MNFDDLRRRADRVRVLPLESVLLACGAVRDAFGNNVVEVRLTEDQEVVDALFRRATASP